MTSFVVPAWAPRHDQIVVRPFEAAERAHGSTIITPEAARDRPQQGLVVAVGPDVNPAAVVGAIVSPGAVVAFGKFAGIPFDDPLTGVQLLVMREIEAILVRADQVDILEHETTAGRTVIHEATAACQFCPTPELDAERARFRAGARASVE